MARVLLGGSLLPPAATIGARPGHVRVENTCRREANEMLGEGASGYTWLRAWLPYPLGKIDLQGKGHGKGQGK